MSELVGNVVRRMASAPGRALARTGISPNAVTLLGAALTTGASAVIALAPVPDLAAGALLLATTFFDALDGAVARHAGKSSRFGAYLDSVMDRVVDAVVLLGLLVRQLQAGRTGDALFLALALATFPLVSYTRAQAEKHGVECKGGTMTRPLRIIVVGVGLAAGVLGPAVAVVAVWSAGTALHRILHVRRALTS